MKKLSTHFDCRVWLLLSLAAACAAGALASAVPAVSGTTELQPMSQPAAPAAAAAAAAAASPAPAPAASASAAAAAAPATAAPSSLDLKGLKQQLEETKAIGIFSKLSLKNQVDDLLTQFRDHYQGKGQITMAQLRRSYDLLLMKVLSLIQDGDQQLASVIVASREAIWGLLADQQKFSTLEI